MRKVNSGLAPDQRPVYHKGVWALSKLLAEANSDENERRRLRARDLTRPGPIGPANIHEHIRGRPYYMLRLALIMYNLISPAI